MVFLKKAAGFASICLSIHQVEGASTEKNEPAVLPQQINTVQASWNLVN